MSQGQVCSAASRLLVQESVHDDVVSRVVEIANAVTPGDPLDPSTTFGALAQEEIFGPVLSTITFRDLDEALSIANDSVNGLGAAVWTRDLATAHEASRRIRAGVVWVNCFDQGDMTVPFGGYKQSGFGRDKGIHALDKYTELKTTWIDLEGSRVAGAEEVR